MSERFPAAEEVIKMQSIVEVHEVARLPFGVGKVGADRHLTGIQNEAFCAGLARNQHQLPSGLWVPADCMDEREIIGLADGTVDPEILLARISAQLAGGTTLATTKAAVAANAVIVRDATSFEDAYDKVDQVLASLGIPDAGHEDCGARKFVKESVANPLSVPTLVRTLGALGVPAEAVEAPLEHLAENKRRLVASGFFDSWTPEWHTERLLSKYPQNYAYLKTAEDDVHGHHASGLLLVKEGHYFAKNAFTAETGAQSFALTLDYADRIADVIGGSDQERALLKLSFRDDSFNVANPIVAAGLEVYADRA